MPIGKESLDGSRSFRSSREENRNMVGNMKQIPPTPKNHEACSSSVIVSDFCFKRRESRLRSSVSMVREVLRHGSHRPFDACQCFSQCSKCPHPSSFIQMKGFRYYALRHRLRIAFFTWRVVCFTNDLCRISSLGHPQSISTEVHQRFSSHSKDVHRTFTPPNSLLPN